MANSNLPLGLMLVALNVLAEPASRPYTPGFGEQASEESFAVDINGRREVAGVIRSEEGRQRAVRFAGGRVTELGTLGGEDSYTTAINAAGAITGSAQNAEGRWRGFLYQPGGGMRDLGTLGGNNSYAMAISRSSHIAGFADTADGDFHAFVSADGRMTDLGTLGGKTSYASGINASGQVVGTAQRADGFRRAFLYQPGQGMVDLGTLGGRISSASAINDAGMVVGASEMPNRGWHAFLHDGKRMIDLGALIGHGSSFATGINASGHVVGTVQADGYQPLMFVYRDGVMSVRPHREGLRMTSKISDDGLVIGAKYDGHRFAATAVTAKPIEPRRLDAWDWFMIVFLGLLGGWGIVNLRRRADTPLHQRYASAFEMEDVLYALRRRLRKALVNLHIS